MTATGSKRPVRRLICVVVLEQLFGLVFHVDVEDGEEKTWIRQACEAGVIRDEQALGLLVERDVRRIGPRQWIVGGVSRVLGGAAVLRFFGSVRAENRNLARAGERDVEVA